MALNLSTSGITNSGTIQAAHVSQSIDALKGTHAYNLTPSGSLNFTGTSTFTGDTTLTGTVQGALSNIISESVTDDSTVSVAVNGRSTSVYILTVNADGNQGSNGIGYVLPRPATAGLAGTTYRIIVGLIGSSATSPTALVRPFTISIDSSNQTLLASIVTNNGTASTVLQRSSGPFVQLDIAGSKLNTGDQFDLFCDGTYWYVTGFSGTNSVTFAN